MSTLSSQKDLRSHTSVIRVWNLTKVVELRRAKSRALIYLNLSQISIQKQLRECEISSPFTFMPETLFPISKVP